VISFATWLKRATGIFEEREAEGLTPTPKAKFGNHRPRTRPRCQGESTKELP